MQNAPAAECGGHGGASVLFTKPLPVSSKQARHPAGLISTVPLPSGELRRQGVREARGEAGGRKGPRTFQLASRLLESLQQSLSPWRQRQCVPEAAAGLRLQVLPLRRPHQTAAAAEQDVFLRMLTCIPTEPASKLLMGFCFF